MCNTSKITLTLSARTYYWADKKIKVMTGREDEYDYLFKGELPAAAVFHWTPPYIISSWYFMLVL